MKCLILQHDKYYTIQSGKMIETTLEYINAFDSSILEANRGLLRQCNPLRLVFLDSASFKNVIYQITNHNAFALFDITNIDMDNIKLKSEHKMIVSQDLKIWDNYYDGSMQSRIDIIDFRNEIDNLKKYVRIQSKPNDFIEKKYNYILMQLNSGEDFDRLCETLYADYKRFDFEANIVYSSGIDKTISITPNFNTKEIIIKVLPRDNIINQDSLGEW